LFELGTHLGDDRQRLDAVAVQVHDDKRRLLLRIFGLFGDVLVGLNEFYFHIELARDLLDLGDKEKVFHEGEDARGRVFPLGKRLHVGNGLGAVMETRALLAGSVALIAITVVHGADEGCSAPPGAAIAAVLTVLSTLASVIVRAVLAAVLCPKVTSASPRFAISRLLRLVHSFIHS